MDRERPAAVHRLALRRCCYGQLVWESWVCHFLPLSFPCLIVLISDCSDLSESILSILFFYFKILLRSIIALQCYSEVNQLYVYTYPLPLDPPPRCLIAEHEPSSLCHTAASPGCQLYTWQCIYVSAVLPVRPTPLPLPLCVQLPIT